MDVAALATALIGAQNAQAQMALAATMIRMNANADASVAKLVEAGQQNIDRLANVASGIGGSLDISV